MIKAVVFDMDGVLVDADKWHYNALNVALQHADVEPISWQEHLTVYKGIPTREKLRILTERKGLPTELWPKILASKQAVTEQIVESFCEPDPEKVEMVRLLARNYRLVVCSNAVRRSVDLMLERCGLKEFFEFTLSNQDVERSKPDPQIYQVAFERLGLAPDECVVVEDSDVGKAAALASGGALCSVNDPSEVNYYRVLRTIRRVGPRQRRHPGGGPGQAVRRGRLPAPEAADRRRRPTDDRARPRRLPRHRAPDRHPPGAPRRPLRRRLRRQARGPGRRGGHGRRPHRGRSVHRPEGRAADRQLRRARAREQRPARRRRHRRVRRDDAAAERRRGHPRLPRHEPEVELRAHRRRRARGRGGGEEPDQRPRDGRHLLLPPRRRLRRRREADDRTRPSRERRVLRLPRLQRADRGRQTGLRPRDRPPGDARARHAGGSRRRTSPGSSPR